MTTMLQTFSFSHNTEETGEFEGLMATASLKSGNDKRMPEVSRRQRRMIRRRRVS